MNLPPTVKSDSDDRLIDQFEDDIKAGTSPDIECVLALLPDDSRQRILLELISIEVFHSVRKGRQVSNTSYARFGEEAVDHANRVREQLSKSKTIKRTVAILWPAAPQSQQVPEMVTRPYRHSKQLDPTS